MKGATVGLWQKLATGGKSNTGDGDEKMAPKWRPIRYSKRNTLVRIHCTAKKKGKQIKWKFLRARLPLDYKHKHKMEQPVVEDDVSDEDSDSGDALSPEEEHATLLELAEESVNEEESQKICTIDKDKEDYMGKCLTIS